MDYQKNVETIEHNTCISVGIKIYKRLEVELKTKLNTN